MSKHRTPRRRSPLNRTVGAGLVTGGIALGAFGLLAPATASADISFGGQSDSPGAAGGNMGGSGASNNVTTIGPGVTVVDQANGNYTGGSGNASVHIPITTSSPFASPNLRWGGQKNSPGAAGGNQGGSFLSNNTTNFRGTFTQVVQRNGNLVGGNNNASLHIPITLPSLP